MKRRTRRANNAIKEQRAAYLFLIPALLGLTFITYVPLLAVFGISLTNLNVGHFIKGGTMPPVKFVGFENFKEIFQNPSIDFLNSIKVTVVFALLAVVCSIVYSMVIAMLLNRKMPGRGFFRAIFYIPYILPATAVMISWWFLLKYDGGLINYILVSLGLGKSMFLSAANTALPSLAMIAVWTSGNLIVIFLAGLQNVPRVYHEAAEIDGATKWQLYWDVVLPLARPALVTLTIFTFIGSYNNLFWPLVLMKTPDN